MSELPKACVNCRSDSLYSSKSRRPFGSELYTALGGMFTPPEMTVVLCQSCGHTSLFADKDARSKVVESPHWKKL